jgi:hypothetical protein
VSRPTHRHGVRGTTLQKASNWAGYAQVSTTPGTFTQVTDTFVVPTIGASAPGVQYAADWVGIGGYNDATLVQTGIQAFVRTRHHHTTVVYDAWTEHLPQAEKQLTLTISAGDTVTATVQETSAGTWLMEVADATTGKTAGVTVSYSSTGASAEVIHERPCIRAPCNTARDLAQLAQTQNVTFGPGSYSVAPPGQAPVEQPLLAATQSLVDIVMTNNNGGQDIATPSAPSSAQDGFTVADGAATPPAPTV